jgi:hypothetical protein
MHDFRRLCSVGRTTRRGIDYLGRLAEIPRSWRRWRDHAERFHVIDSIVIEPMNGTSRNAQCLSWANVDLFSITGNPGLTVEISQMKRLPLLPAMCGLKSWGNVIDEGYLSPAQTAEADGCLEYDGTGSYCSKCGAQLSSGPLCVCCGKKKPWATTNGPFNPQS